MKSHKQSIRFVIKGTHKVAIGHQPHITGTGAHRNLRNDKKLRREDGKRRCQE